MSKENEHRLEDIEKYEKQLEYVRLMNEYRGRRDEQQRLVKEKHDRILNVWNEYIVPVLEKHGFELESIAYGYEVDGSALQVTYNGESTFLYQKGDC